MRSQIEDAIETDQPFLIRTADGREYLIPSRDHIVVSPKATFVQVFDDEERVTSMTAVEYRPTL